MTPQVKKFIFDHKDKLDGRIIEIGSKDENGGIRDIVKVDVGVDMRKGKGVDLICPVEKLLDHFESGTFDACVSTETLEHVEDWQGFVNVTWDLVKDGGYLVMTMASLKKGRHGYPNDYWRFTPDQIKEIYPRAEWAGEVGIVSIGWVVKKEGDRPNLDVNPKKV